MHRLPIFLLATSLVVGCSKKDDDARDGTSGLAKLALNHASADLTARGFDAERINYELSELGVKMLGVNLVPDIKGDDPEGVSPVIWANSACKVKTTETTVDEDDGEVNYGYSSIDGECTDSMVTEFFNLARSSADVNEELNSQSLKVLPGTYKYVSLEFCIGGAKTNNVKFKAEGMTEAMEVKLGTCGINSIEADPPIKIAEGESVVVSLEYSLENLAYEYGEGMGKGDNCYFNDDETIRRCIDFPALKPSFKKAE